MNKTTVALSKEEYEKVVSTIQYGFEYKNTKCYPNPQIATALIIQANTGLRIGDLLNLKLSSIVRENGRYHFNIVEQKTKKKRTFTIAPEVYTYMQEYALANGIKPDSKLFNISSRGVNKHLKKVCDYLGMEGIGTHSFRKFFCQSIYENNGYNIMLIKTLLQHASIACSQKYLCVSPQVVEKALLNHIYIPELNVS